MTTNAYTKSAIARETGARSAPVIVPTLQTRLNWAGIWSARIAALLDAPVVRGALGRIFRMRFFMDDDYVVATMLQAVKAGQADAKLTTYIVRPFYRTLGNNSSAVMQQLVGDYSVDEVVAFIRLDLVNPDSAEWRDETKYMDIEIPTKDMVRQLAQGVH